MYQLTLWSTCKFEAQAQWVSAGDMQRPLCLLLLSFHSDCFRKFYPTCCILQRHLSLFELFPVSYQEMWIYYLKHISFTELISMLSYHCKKMVVVLQNKYFRKRGQDPWQFENCCVPKHTLPLHWFSHFNDLDFAEFSLKMGFLDCIIVDFAVKATSFGFSLMWEPCLHFFMVRITEKDFCSTNKRKSILLFLLFPFWPKMLRCIFQVIQLLPQHSVIRNKH